MLTLGAGEIAVIFVVALVLFGPKKLPELGRTVGRAMTEFRRASNDLKATFEREMHTLEQDTRSIQSTARQTAREIADHASYDIAPSETMWNPLEEALNEAKASTGEAAAAIESAATQDEPATVGASEVSGAESPAVETASAPAIEGAVPRGSYTPEPEPEQEPATEVAEAALKDKGPQESGAQANS